MSRFISCLSYGALTGCTKRPTTLISRQFTALAIANGTSSGHYNNFQDYKSTGKSIDSTRFLISMSNKNAIIINTSRNIFGPSALGISKLDELRNNKEHLFSSDAKDRYIERLTDYVAKGDHKSIVKDDLVNMLGIAETEQHLDLLEDIVANSEGEQKEFFHGWGATIARLYYKMDLLERAEKNIKDTQRFGEFFNLRSCYKIVMTMLFNAGQYEKVVDMMRYAEERFKDRKLPEGAPTDSVIFDRDLVTVTFAAMAKQTGQSNLLEAERLYTKVASSDSYASLRTSSFFAYIAIKNGNPKLALNIVSQAQARSYVSLRDMKIIALIQLERFEDVLLAMREHTIRHPTNALLKSTVDLLQQSKENIQDDAVRQELEDILTEVRESGLVSEKTLDELVFQPIEYKQRMNDFGSSFSGQRGGQFGRDSPPFRRNQYNNDSYQGRNQDFARDRPPFRRNNYNNDSYQDMDSARDRPPFRRNNYNDDRRKNYIDDEDMDQEPPRYSSGGRGGGGSSFGGGAGGRGGKRFSHQNLDFDS